MGWGLIKALHYATEQANNLNSSSVATTFTARSNLTATECVYIYMSLTRHRAGHWLPQSQGNQGCCRSRQCPPHTTLEGACSSST